jgi:glycosyltransferase involved in cell wall biosynthesis
MGATAPALFIPHTNPYPLETYLYFVLVRHFANPFDTVICGSLSSCQAFQSLTGLKAYPLCTFGIKEHFRPLNKSECQDYFQLSRDKTYLIYTGRFMNDKNIEALLTVFHRLIRTYPNLRLIVSCTHIDAFYFNKLSPLMAELPLHLYYRLPSSDLVKLYNCSSIFVTAATSVFETYGKSQLESLACGVPVIAPEWDGFTRYVTKENGSLVSVKPTEPNADNPYSFAQISCEHLEKTIIEILDRKDPSPIQCPAWARYPCNLLAIKKLCKELSNQSTELKSTAYPDTLRTQDPAINFSYFIPSLSSLLRKNNLTQLGELLSSEWIDQIIARKKQVDPQILKDLHDIIFHKVSESEKRVPIAKVSPQGRQDHAFR